MTSSNRKRSIVISILLLTAFLVLVGLFPSAGSILSITLLLFSFIAASLAVVKRHRSSHLQGRISRGMFLRNTTLEIFGILLAMTLAGLLGRHVSQVATVQISHNLTRIMAGILIGVGVGAGVGLLMKRTWRRLTKVEQF